MASKCLLKKIQIKTNPDNTRDNFFKYNGSINWSASNIIILSATLRPTFASVFPYLGRFSSALSLSNFKDCESPRTEYQWRHERLFPPVTFWYLCSLPIIHSFLYVKIRFRTFWIATIIANVPTKLYLSQMEQISGSHHFISSQI